MTIDDFRPERRTLLHGTGYKSLLYFLLQLNIPHFSYTDHNCHVFVATDLETAERRENDGRCPTRGEGSSALELRALAHSVCISVTRRAEGTRRHRTADRRGRRLERSPPVT